MDGEEVAAKERMLRLWSTLSHTSDVTVVTTDQTVIQADALLPNASQSLFAMTQLQTPLGIYPSAVMRAHDVFQINVSLTPQELQELLAE